MDDEAGIYSVAGNLAMRLKRSIDGDGEKERKRKWLEVRCCGIKGFRNEELCVCEDSRNFRHDGMSMVGRLLGVA